MTHIAEPHKGYRRDPEHRRFCGHPRDPVGRLITHFRHKTLQQPKQVLASQHVVADSACQRKEQIHQWEERQQGEEGQRRRQPQAAAPPEIRKGTEEQRGYGGPAAASAHRNRLARPVIGPVADSP